MGALPTRFCRSRLPLTIGTPDPERKVCGNRSKYRLRRRRCQTRFNNPLERQRDLQRRWARLLQRTAASNPASVAARINCSGNHLATRSRAALLVGTMPPRDPNDDDGMDDDDEDEAEEDREPAVKLGNEFLLAVFVLILGAVGVRSSSLMSALSCLRKSLTSPFSF